MAEEQKNNQSSALEQGANAAHTIQAAVKTGKAIANASKGAAVAGPYGAATGALWGARKHVGKIILAIIALFLLPVLVIMMLPGLIFGGFGSASSSFDSDKPILNSETAIVSNANEITFTINSILGEGIADVEKRIKKDFKKAGCDCMEILNPYENNPTFNANLFISQYCAYKNDNFKGISLADMEQILRDNVDYLYSYTWIEEFRERPMTEEELEKAKAEAEEAAKKEHATEENTETESTSSATEGSDSEQGGDNSEHSVNETAETETTNDNESSTESDAESDSEILYPTTVTEKWRVYTLVYNGETYFADQIFALSDSQKALADNYAYNLSLFLGDGMLQNLSAWNGNIISSLGNVSFTDGATEVVCYNQLDERYAGVAYGTDVIGGYGCGPTAMAIVVSSLSGETVDPVEMAEWSYNNGYWCKNSGSYHALIPAAAKNWKLSVSGCSASEPQQLLDALAEGKLVVAIMGKGHFTSSGHFIVLRGVKDGQILVADPASYSRSEQTWDLSLILNEASKNAGAGGPFWIIG